jgi:hypothetical protein
VTDSGAHPRLPDRPDRLGLHGLARARHQRRAEDHGHHHPGPDRQRLAAAGEGADLGHRLLRLAISLGTYIGGWRVIRALGKGLVEIESPQGMAAESSSAAVILLSSSFGYSLSTTHVATGSILGSGVGKKGAEVRWSVAGRMATAWVLTLPSAAVVGAAPTTRRTASAATPASRRSSWCSCSCPPGSSSGPAAGQRLDRLGLPSRTGLSESSDREEGGNPMAPHPGSTSTRCGRTSIGQSTSGPCSVAIILAAIAWGIYSIVNQS